MQRPELLLFTIDFPYGMSEASFLPSELKYLSSKFEKIVLFPISRGNQSNQFKLDNNVSIEEKFCDTKISRPKLNVPVMFQLMQILINEGFNVKNKISYVKNLRNHLSQLLIYLFYAQVLHEILDSKKQHLKNAIFYSYWCAEWASIISILKIVYPQYNDVKFVSRAHGIDLYEYRQDSGYIFPRITQLSQLDILVTISKDGENYMLNKYKQKIKKLVVSKLGVENDSPIQSFCESDTSPKTYVLVSCSRAVSVKRLDLIVEILKNSELNIKWIHFGDGPLLTDLIKQSEVLPENVEVEFRGFINNADLFEFYKTNQVDLFINVSESEGIPVSIMEAISFGIPVLATDVGAVSEIVREPVGRLLKKDFNFIDAEETLHGMLKNQTMSSRENIVEFWKNNFSAEVNYTNFSQLLVGELV